MSPFKPTNDSWARVHNDFFYFTQLFNSPNKYLLAAYVRLWHRLSPTILQEMLQFLTNLQSDETTKCINATRPYEFKRWGYNGLTVSMNISRAKTWFRTREKWLTEAIEQLSIDTGIEMPIETVAKPHNTIYSLNGKAIKKDARPLRPGIYITNGQKIIVH